MIKKIIMVRNIFHLQHLVFLIPFLEKNQEPDDDEDDEPDSSSPRTSSISAFPSSSQSSITSASSTSSGSTISRLAVQAILKPDPRYGRRVISSPGPRPTPTPTGGTDSPRTLKSYFNLAVANARKHNGQHLSTVSPYVFSSTFADIDAMEFVHQIDTSGVLAGQLPSSL